jgi:hypothetical protein
MQDQGCSMVSTTALFSLIMHVVATQDTADVFVFMDLLCISGINHSTLLVAGTHYIAGNADFEELSMQGGECRCGVNHSTFLLAGAHGSHARHCCGWLGAHTAGQK